jgi:enoyl-CoA hydratase
VTDSLTIERGDRAVTVGFTRAEKRNALDLATSRALDAALDEAAQTPLPLVLRSATPGMFVAGTDVAALRERSVADSLGRINARLFQRVEDHPWPTIAVVDGWALGGGCELALACDLRISTDVATWGLPEVRLGIIPSGGGLTRLAHLVGGSVASDLVLTGRRIDGVEAHRIGLAQRLSTREQLEQTLDELLDDLAATSTQAVRLAKEAMRVDGDRHRLVDAAAQALCIGSDEAQRRMAALLERRSR